MIYVWLESPTASPWASETAAPVFAEMAKKTVLLLNIPPDHSPATTRSKITCLPSPTCPRSPHLGSPPNATAIITEAAIDSRQVIPGSLFVAIPGEKSGRT
jgi:hypothetical protein